VIYCCNGIAITEKHVAWERGKGWRRTVFEGEFSGFWAILVFTAKNASGLTGGSSSSSVIVL